MPETHFNVKALGHFFRKSSKFCPLEPRPPEYTYRWNNSIVKFVAKQSLVHIGECASSAMKSGSKIKKSDFGAAIIKWKPYLASYLRANQTPDCAAAP